LLQSPETNIDKAVIEQITIVSANTSKTPQSPWRTGWSVVAAACAIGALPRPASFVNTPRATPYFIESIKVAPIKPPTAAWPVNALLNIKPKASGIWDTFVKIITKPPTI